MCVCGGGGVAGAVLLFDASRMLLLCPIVSLVSRHCVDS